MRDDDTLRFPKASLLINLSFSAALAFLIPFANNSLALTLKEAFEAAQQNTEKVKGQKIEEEISQIKKSNATSAFKPKINLLASELRRDPVPTSSSATSSTSSLTESRSHSIVLNIDQPLFAGGGEYDLLRAATIYPDISRWRRIEAEIDLYTQLAQIFYQLLSFREQELTLKDQESLLIQRIQYLRSRVKIGRSRKTELLVAESQLSRLLSEMANLRTRQINGNEELSRYSGLSEWSPVRDPLGEKSEQTLIEHSQSSVNMDKVPKIQISKNLLDQMKAEANAINGDYWPKVDLSGNYYFDRSGSLRDSQWDIGLAAKWELYGGGVTTNAAREKYLEIERLKLQIVDLERSQKAIILRLILSLKEKTEEVKRLAEAVALAKQSYQENMKDSQAGLISDLEALRSLDDYLQIKRSYDQIQFEPKLIYFELMQAKGIQP